MNQQIQYIIDSKGNKTSVLISLKQWEELQNDFLKLQNKLRILSGIKEAFQEVKNEKRKGKKLQTLDAFIDENRNKNF